ncbi:MAG: undecaprenyl-diphosphate phosphatase [Halieaceae bacterium]|nr:undecaprenyl-diphosphate phosphatase [Halieaceae bacterium]
MDAWQALCLALLQGLTEFLPISSSAHLILPSLLLQWPDQGLAFDVAVHLGTLLAVLTYFRRDLAMLARGSLAALPQRRLTPELREVLFLALATLPAIIAGVLISDRMDQLRSIAVIAATTILFGLLLGIADRRVRSDGRLTVESWSAALIIGCAQAVALVPGTSRSGITITAALLLGLSREAAARFSFLMSIPVILGAALLQTLDLIADPEPVAWAVLGGAALMAALSAYTCIALFIRLIERVGMMPFVVYRLALGVLLLFVWWSA